jgi:hypothetical protein
MEKNTAGKSVVMQEVKTLRSRVNVIIWHVRSQFGSSLREVPLVWQAENRSRSSAPFRDRKTRTRVADVKNRRSINCETH